MYTKAQICEDTYTDLRMRSQVKYSHTEGNNEDQWIITCPSCAGNGYDIEVDGFSTCTTCDGMGESSPVSECEVREFFTGSSALPV